MIDCNTAREQIALQPALSEELLREHFAQCPACASYRLQHHKLDAVLQQELRWEAPAALTARLLALTATPPAVMAAPAPQLALRPRPKRWYVTLVYVLTVTAISLSLAIAWQIVSVLIGPVNDQLALFQAVLAQGLDQLTQTLPESRYVIAFFLRVRDQLLWLLLVAVLWAALDKWNPQFNFRRQRLS